MESQVFVICHGATLCGGSLNLLGTMDIVQSTGFPFAVTLPMAVLIRFGRSEIGRHQLTIEGVDDDGNQVVAFGPIEIDVQFSGEFGFNYSSLSHALTPYIQVEFARPGEYEFQLSVNGTRIASTTLFVAPA